MFRKGEQEEVRHVSERYIGKSDPYIVMVSTPDAPGGLFYNIENEPEETCHVQEIEIRLSLWIRKDLHTRRNRESQTFTFIR